MKFKFYLIPVFLFAVHFNIYSQDNHVTIGVTSWIYSPDEAQLEKPLVYVDFWATWCAPCIGSMPHTIQLNEKFGGDVLFMILTDEPPAKAKAFIERKQWQSLYAASDVSGSTLRRLGIRAIPHAVLLGPDGQLLWRGHPSDMSDALMQSFISRYGQKKGNPKRIRSIAVALEKNNSWKTYVAGNDTLYYYKEKNAENGVEKTGRYIFVSGNDRFILGYAYGVPEKYVFVSRKPLEFYRFKFNGTDEMKMKALLKSFFRQIFPHVRVETKREEVYLLSGGDREGFLNAGMYDFGLGDNVVSEDDYGISIDNATPAQMADDLSSHCRYNFEYVGDDTGVYDWNIQYKKIDDLLEFLIGELGFKVKKGVREVKILKAG